MAREDKEVAFEESLSDEWAHDLDVTEVPLRNRQFFYLGAAIFLVGALVAGRVMFLGTLKGDFYKARAEANLGRGAITPAPRGLIYDRSGMLLAENLPTFRAILDVREFLKDTAEREKTLKAIEDILGLPQEEVWSMIAENDSEGAGEPIVIAPDLTSAETVQIKGANLKALSAESGFKRKYSGGESFSALLGYTGLVSPADLEQDPKLDIRDVIGKAGVELYDDKNLRGQPGLSSEVRDARGRVVMSGEKRDPQIGGPLHLTIDAGFQKYFYQRMQDGLSSLGRDKGVGLALDPRSGEILALLSFPTYDNNLFIESSRSDERRVLLGDPSKPLFNRAVGGLYNPGSTIKPLVGVAALKEGVIDTQRTIFSPGYLDVPNPYDSENPTRFLDWRYQGDVNLAAAIAQSSNVYFYTVGGGADGVRGLGISRLIDWWQRFGLGKPTGVDFPGEGKGFLPSPEWKEKTAHKQWLLGDTYNVSIGQGDLLLTPIQLMNYISAIANGGKIYQPVINKDSSRGKAIADLSEFLPEIKEVQKGMIAAVRSPLGTANRLSDLPFPVAAKTGSAQVFSNTQENAFFVGYTPLEKPQVAILILIENSREGSLNAVPIAKDVLNWYYWNRIRH